MAVLPDPFSIFPKGVWARDYLVPRPRDQLGLGPIGNGLVSSPDPTLSREPRAGLASLVPTPRLLVRGWGLGHGTRLGAGTRLLGTRSNPEVLFKALTLLVNLLYIFIYAYAPLP